MLEPSVVSGATLETARPTSCEEVAKCVNGRLSCSFYPALQKVSCRVDGHRLILRGKVTSFYLKQLAQELVRPAAGVRGIVNELEVIATGKP